MFMLYSIHADAVCSKYTVFCMLLKSNSCTNTQIDTDPLPSVVGQKQHVKCFKF